MEKHIRTWPRFAAPTLTLIRCACIAGNREIVPSGEVRDDFNHVTEGDNKRMLNVEHEVNDSDNIKQDMSIDVYGRGSEASDDADAEIANLYNV